MAEQTKSIADLAREAQDAMQEADRLARRMGEIDAEIEEEKARISRDRIRAAKAGQRPFEAEDRLTLEGLQAEREDLPELHFAARLNAAAAHIALEQARIRQVEAKIPDAEEEYFGLADHAARAQQQADEAGRYLNGLQGQRSVARARSREQVKLLERVEQEGPKPLL